MTKDEHVPFGHPRQCHLCKYNGVNVRRKAEGKPLDEEAANACLSCQGVDMMQIHDGVSWVHLDAAKNPDTVYTGRTAPLYRHGGKRERETLHTPCNPDERERYLRILQTFSELSWDDAGLVCAMLRGMGIIEIARLRGVKYESIFARWQKIKSANPVFGALANGLMGCGRGRKPKEHKQMELEFK